MKEIANGFYVTTHAFIWQMTILQGNKGTALKGTRKPNIGYKDQRKYNVMLNYKWIFGDSQNV